MTRRQQSHAPIQPVPWFAPPLLAAGLSAAVACQMEPGRDLGQTVDGRALSVTAEGASLEPFGVPALEFAGRWVGTAEDPLALGGERSEYAFPSGATTIQLELPITEQEGRLSIDGRITFGGGAAPPPPTDPERGYPTDVDYVDFGYFMTLVYGPFAYYGPLPPYEGFAYAARDALYPTEVQGNSVADGVVRLAYDTQEVLAPWCEMQQPQSDGNGGFDCAGGQNYYYEAGQCSLETNNLAELLDGLSDEQVQAMSGEDWASIDAQVVRTLQPVDCNKQFLCVTQRCTCDETSCRANVSDFRGVGGSLPNSPSHAELSLRQTEDGSGLIGVFSSAVFTNERRASVPIGVVHFERAD